MGPTECKYCGHELVDETTNDELFACGSSHRFSVDTWFQSKGCMEIIDLRERLSAARQVLEGARRYDFIDLDLIESWDAQKAVEILTGKQIYDAS